MKAAGVAVHFMACPLSATAIARGLMFTRAQLSPVPGGAGHLLLYNSVYLRNTGYIQRIQVSTLLIESS